MYLKKKTEANGDVYLSVMEKYYDRSKKTTRERTVEGIGHLSTLKKEYDDSNPLKVFEREYNTILDRKAHPKEGSYTNYLFDKGIDKILKKVGEECTEIIIAAKNPNPEEIKYEMADFLYHAMVLMVEKEKSAEKITAAICAANPAVRVEEYVAPNSGAKT